MVDDSVNEAVDKDLIGREEFGFINSLIQRFKADIIKKEKLIHQITQDVQIGRKLVTEKFQSFSKK